MYFYLFNNTSTVATIRRLLASRSPTAFHCKQPSVLQTGPVARVATHVPAANASTAAIIIVIRRGCLPSALTVSTHASVVPETVWTLDRFRKVVIHLFDWSSLSSSFVVSIVFFVAFTTRSQHFSPQEYTTTTTITTPIRAEDDVSTQQHEMMNFYPVLRQTFFQFD